ncbi:MAG TPA: NAD(P)-dependent oxidoreductase [Thermomicrobiales bacterium]|nr:NAD(P)-dependent oxidoreductase [Thermomicrobiales bacterium]
MAVLVTGLGYLGAALAEDLLRHGERVVGLENGFATDPRALDRLAATGVEIVAGDVADSAAVERAFGVAPIETVYHYAAQASAHPDAAPADYTERANLQGPRMVLDAMLRHGARTLVYASSFKVYGERPTGLVDERYPYGAFRDLSHLSKVYVEKLLELYAGLHGLRCLALRLGIVHGPGPVFKTDGRFMTAPNRFSLQAARGEPLTVHDGGRTQAGFVHLADATRAALAAVAHEGFAGYTPLNVVGEVASLAALARTVVQAGAARGLAVAVSGLDVATPDEAPPAFAVASELDALGFRYAHTLGDGVGAALDHFLAGAAAGGVRA